MKSILSGKVSHGLLLALTLSVFQIKLANAELLSSELSIQEAEQIALRRDPLVKKHIEMSKSFENQADADRSLPNPMLNMSMSNLPVDTYSRSQEPMTQARIAVEQPLPRGKSRKIKSAHKKTLSSRHTNLSIDRSRIVLRETRKNWLELYYWTNAEKIVLQNRRLFKLMMRVTEDQYRAGRSMQHDLIRAQLEIDLLDDRLIMIKTKQEAARSALSKWVGFANANRPMPKRLPSNTQFANIGRLHVQLKRHPLLASAQDVISAKRNLVDLARQNRKPKFSLYASYGQRQERTDFASVGIKMDLPLFRRGRNNKTIAASENNLSSAMRDYQEQLAKLKASLESHYRIWLQLKKRKLRYQKIIVPKARTNSTATTSSYQNKSLEFSTLVKARTMELSVALKSLRIKVDLGKTEAEILYLIGEKS